MTDFHLKPTHAPVRAYYEALERFGQGNFDNEGNIRGAFERLLEHCARKLKWTVVPEYKIVRKGQQPARVDAALIDEFNLPRACWEAKDLKDDLEKEIQKKFQAGYPRNNILFQTPTHAVLYHGGSIRFNESIAPRQEGVEIPRADWRRPDSRCAGDFRGGVKMDIRCAERPFLAQRSHSDSSVLTGYRGAHYTGQRITRD